MSSTKHERLDAPLELADTVQPQTSLPALVARLPSGPEGKREFEKLANVVLRAWAERDGFKLHGPPPGQRQPWINIVATGVDPQRWPIDFRVLWQSDDVRTGPGPHRLAEHFQMHRADFFDDAGHRRPVRSSLWLLFPRELLPEEHTWLQNQEPWAGYADLNIQGMSFWEKHLRAVPALFARYYPELAAGHLPGFTPFDFRTFAQTYRKEVTHDKQYVHLLGFPPDTLREKDAHAHIRVADLFVPTVFAQASDPDKRTSLAELLTSEQSVLVQGDPGMGKTMLLTYLALLHADPLVQLPGFSPLPQRIPFFVSLREYAREEPQISLMEYLAKRARDKSTLLSAHAAFFEASLRMGEAILLLDGLDEVGSSAARRRMADRVRELRRTYPDCPVWVTSRIHGYTHDIRLPDDEFAHVRIGPLDDAQVDDFLKRWYTIQSRDDGSHADRKASLRKAIFQTPPVRALATNPLLLTLMAFVHRFLGHLPQDRGELYEQCVNMLLRSWLEARERPEKHPFECMGLSRDIPRSYLEALALHVQEHESLRQQDESGTRGLFSRDDALEFLTTHHLASDRREPQISAGLAREEMREFLDYACDRVGLLVDRGGGQMSFLHLSFQEYLAATCGTLASTIREQERDFEKHFCNPSWSEVLLLRLYLFSGKRGRTGQTIFDELVHGMLQALETDNRLAGWILLGRALRDRLDVRAVQRVTVLRRLVQAFAQEATYESDVFVVLRDIQDFAKPDVVEELRQACVYVQAQRAAKEAVGALYVQANLFGTVEGAAQRFGARADVSAVLPDLVAFADVAEVAALLAQKSTPAIWEAVFSAMKADDAYRWTLGWATGVFTCPVRSDAPLLGAARWLRRKINAEVESRETFAAKYKRSKYRNLLTRPGTLHWEDVEKLYRIDAPLGFAVRRAAYGTSLEPAQEQGLAFVNLAVNRLSAGSDDTAMDGALTLWMTQAIRKEVERLSPPSTWSEDLPQRVATDFGREFVRDFVRDFGREFVRYFVRDFVRDFVREFVRDFVRDFVRYFVRDFGRYFGRYFVSYFGRDFVSYFVRDFGRDFVRYFGRSFGRIVEGEDPDLWRDLNLQPEAPDLETQWQRAMDKESNVERVLASDAFWTALYWRDADVSLDERQPRETISWNLHNPLALPLALSDLGSVACFTWTLLVGRDLHLRYPDGDVPDEIWEQAFAERPLSAFWTALAWNEHAQHMRDHHGTLAGPLGALALAHADYASLMTGCNLEHPDVYPAWAALVCAVGPDALQQLRHFASTPAPATSPAPQPASMPVRTPMPEPPALFTYLHLSDVHLGLSKAGDHQHQSRILAELHDEIAHLSDHGLPRPDTVFITGDIAQSGKTSDYEATTVWLDRLLKTLGLTADRVFLVPGNHDVDRDVDKQRAIGRLLRGLREKDDLDEALADPDDCASLMLRKRAYLDFAKRFAPACYTPDKPEVERLVWTHRERARGNLTVHVVGLDTALLAADNTDAKKLRLGQTQLARLNDVSVEREFVVVLGHHPLNKEWLHPDEEKELERAVRKRAHVYLSGHVHDHDSARIISGGGTECLHVIAGAAYGGREAEIPLGHAYNIGAVLPPFEGKPLRLRIHPRRFSFKNNDFRTDVDNVPPGQTFAEHPLKGIRVG